MTSIHRAIAIAALAFISTPVFALDILLSNDDGLSSNLKALYETLKADGHDVIVSVPCSSLSGRSASIAMYSTDTIDAVNDSLIELEGGCHNGAAPIGAPSVGPFTKPGFDNGDYNYVHGSPVMATMYGLDILAMNRWGKAPDLVLSGPNEGQNLGRLIISAGTVGNVQFAATRGIPAIALSAGANSKDDVNLANPDSQRVARLARKLLRLLERKAVTRGTPLLPTGVALNVNFPDTLATDTPFAFSRIGTFDLIGFKFVIDPYIGLGATFNDPATALPEQADDEAIVVAQGKIAISAMQVGFEAPQRMQFWLKQYLHVLFQSGE